MHIKTLLTCCVFLSVLANRCSYVGKVKRQWVGELKQAIAPSQSLEKTLSPEKCSIIYGKIQSTSFIEAPIVVAAFSFRYGTLDVVATHQLNGPGYYSLYLPQGQYQLYVFADMDNDSVFNNFECVGTYKESPLLPVDNQEPGGPIVRNVNIIISPEKPFKLDMPFNKKVAKIEDAVVSEFYPPGSIRSLDSDLFSYENGQLGIYSPPAFLERAGIYFYALQERDLRKIPIVFVHGIGGTPRDWKYIVDGIDRNTFDPWFFYYPSGEDLDKLANIFYEIFLSGEIIDMRRRKLAICAHSMGGLVARTAINLFAHRRNDNFLKLFISFSTPYGGNDAAASGVEKAPVVIPSWRDIAAKSPFLDSLYTIQLPKNTKFHLFFGFRNDNNIRGDENSDGTITLKSQLEPRAQFFADALYGYDETHTSILESPDVLNKLNEILSEL